MKVVYLGEELPEVVERVLFVCGSGDVANAVHLEFGHLPVSSDDVIVVPVRRPGSSRPEDVDGAEALFWRQAMLACADAVACWFGELPEAWQALIAAQYPHKTTIGAPKGAPWGHEVLWGNTSPAFEVRQTQKATFATALRSIGAGVVRKGLMRKLPKSAMLGMVAWIARHEQSGYVFEDFRVFRQGRGDDWSVEVQMRMMGETASRRIVYSPRADHGLTPIVIYAGDTLAASTVLLRHELMATDLVGTHAWRLIRTHERRQVSPQKMRMHLGLDLDADFVRVDEVTNRDGAHRQRFPIFVAQIAEDVLARLVASPRPWESYRAVPWRDLPALGVPTDEIGVIALAITEHERLGGIGPLFAR